MIKLFDLRYIVCGKTDMCYGIDTLADMVKDKFDFNLFSGQVFLFCGGSQYRFKALPRIRVFENGKMG